MCQFREDIKMKFGILKCDVVLLPWGKKWEGIKLPNGEEIDEANIRGYKYLVILEIDEIMCDKMKRKMRKGW